LTGDGPGTPGGPERWDAAILGGGAAGLWAAGTAAARGRRVVVLEKNRRVCVKVLASGGGACNLTTTLSADEAARWFGRRGARFLAPAFRALSPAALVAAFETLGVPTETEPALEKVWPVSRRARDVAEALLVRARGAGATVWTDTPALALAREVEGFRVETPRGALRVPRVLVAVGGRSYPRTGTTGDAYAWLEGLGHTVTPLAPALVPLVVDLPWVRALTGIALPVEARVLDTAGATLFARHRPVLFTHLGLSGPAAMDVSRWFALPAPDGPRRLVLDLLPETDESRVRADLEAALARAPGAPGWRALPEALPERLRRALLGVVGLDGEARAGGLSRDRRHALVQALKRLEVPVAGTRGYDHAEVTTGGVHLDEVDAGTMASQKVPGLFVAGEVLDLDGPIGGFSFQAAFATGELAGRAL
jgi:predicted Rossmann fold flavoprotein